MSSDEIRGFTKTTLGGSGGVTQIRTVDLPRVKRTL